MAKNPINTGDNARNTSIKGMWLVSRMVWVLHILLLTCRQAPLRSDNGQDYAQGFRIEQKQGYTYLTLVNVSQTGGRPIRYLLKRKEQSLPATRDYQYIIPIPLKRVITLSNVQIGYITALKQQATIIAVSSPNFVYNKTLRKKISQSEITTIGAGNDLNLEKIIQLKPDCVFAELINSSEISRYQPLKRAGIPVVFTSDWLETGPLARAHWLLYYAVFYQQKKKGQEIFDSIKKQYQQVKEKITNTIHRPEVLIGFPYKGVWYMPGGRSYMAGLLKDSGAHYHWQNDKHSGGIPLDYEAVLPIALKAQIWLSPGQVTNFQKLQQKDPRVKKFPVFQKQKIYNFTKTTLTTGANDYWESGPVKPHIILKDLGKILHPDLFTDHQSYFYEALQ